MNIIDVSIKIKEIRLLIILIYIVTKKLIIDVDVCLKKITNNIINNIDLLIIILNNIIINIDLLTTIIKDIINIIKSKIHL